jgi:hypothetical protein
MRRSSARIYHRGWVRTRIMLLLLSLIGSIAVLFLFTSVKVFTGMVMLYAHTLPPQVVSYFMANQFPTVYSFYNLLYQVTESTFLAKNATIIEPMLLVCYCISLHYILTHLRSAYVEYKHFKYNWFPMEPRKFSRNLILILILIWLSLIYIFQNPEIFHMFANSLVSFCQADYLADFKFVTAMKEINFIVYYAMICLTFFPTSAEYGYLIIPVLQFAYAWVLHHLIVLYKQSI